MRSRLREHAGAARLLRCRRGSSGASWLRGAGTIFKAVSAHNASTIAASCRRRVAGDRRAQVVFHEREVAQHAFDGLARRGRRARSPSCPRRARRAARAAAAPPASGRAAWRGGRSDRARRSIRPLSQSRSSSRVSVIGCRSRISASSDCLRPSRAVEPQQHRPLARGSCRTGAPAGRHRSAAGGLRP